MVDQRLNKATTAPQLPANSVDDRPNHRTRRSHNKVRTGCITCKIRRKKCDETKPHCLRCTSTGRTCDGYAVPTASGSTFVQAVPGCCSSGNPQSSPVAEAQPHVLIEFPGRESAKGVKCIVSTIGSGPVGLINVQRSIPRGPTRHLFTSDVDSHCFDYFRLFTAPQLGNYWGSSIWRKFIIWGAMSYPVLLKAAAAAGAAHRRFNLGISREAFEYCAISDRLHKEAVRTLFEFQKQNCMGDQQTRGAGSPTLSRGHSAAIVMAASMIHGVFESLQSNHDNAIKFISLGLRAFLDNPMSLLYSESLYKSHDEFQASLIMSMFDRLRRHAARVYGREPYILQPQSTTFDQYQSPPMPRHFSSLHEALDLLYTELDRILKTPTSLWVDTAARRHAQSAHVLRILQWSAALAEFLNNTWEWTEEVKQRSIMLRVIRNVGYFVLYLVLFARDDHPDCLSASRTTNYYRHSGVDRDHELAINNPQLWNLVHTSPNLATNLARICVLVDEYTDPTRSPMSLFTGHKDEYDLSLDTGIGPPRLALPGPYSSAKTRHLVRTLLDPSERDEIVERGMFGTDWARYDEKWVEKPADWHGTTDAATHLQANPEIRSKINDANADEQTSCGSSTPGGNAAIYGIAEALSSIEEHAVLDATKQSLLLKGVKPRWIDVTCFLEERLVLVRYCRAATSADVTPVATDHTVSSGTSSSLPRGIDINFHHNPHPDAIDVPRPFQGVKPTAHTSFDLCSEFADNFNTDFAFGVGSGCSASHYHPENDNVDTNTQGERFVFRDTEDSEHVVFEDVDDVHRGCFKTLDGSSVGLTHHGHGHVNENGSQNVDEPDGTVWVFEWLRF